MNIETVTSKELGNDEKAVLALLLQGLSNIDIANRLGLSPIHVSLLVSQLEEKLGATNKAELLKMAKDLEMDLQNPDTYITAYKQNRIQNLRLENYNACNEVKAWLKTGCAKYTLILLLILFLWLFLLPRYQRWQREWLFCEVIKPGMSSIEVLEILDQHGEFGVNRYDRGEDTFMVLVSPFENWGTEMRYGGRGLELNFRDGILGSVIERYHLEDGIRNVCE